MERPALWKLAIIGTAFAGLAVAGAGTAAADDDVRPSYPSPALYAGFDDDWDDWYDDDWDDDRDDDWDDD